jgi:hypothetical protein
MPKWLQGYKTFVLLGIYVGLQWLPRFGIVVPPELSATVLALAIAALREGVKEDTK